MQANAVGSGSVEVTPDGEPEDGGGSPQLTINRIPDVNAVVAWSSGQRVSVTSQVRVSRTVYSGVSGETYNMQFMAIWSDIVPPSL